MKINEKNRNYIKGIMKKENKIRRIEKKLKCKKIKEIKLGNKIINAKM